MAKEVTAPIAEPDELIFDPTTNHQLKVVLSNPGTDRLAFKLKTRGQHQLYAAAPVRGFLAKNGGNVTIKVQRTANDDDDESVMVIHYQAAEESAVDAKKLFTPSGRYPFMCIPLYIEDKDDETDAENEKEDENKSSNSSSK